MNRKSDYSESSWSIVLKARKLSRIRAHDIINGIIDGFIELHGDRRFGDDSSIIGGIGFLGGVAVTVIGQQKGKDITEMELHQYGMTRPEGYRKALRLMKQANKFKRPIICLVDTPGAFPGIEAEEHGQAEAIANNLYEMSLFRVPIFTIILGEGGSGGALALSLANRVFILEDAIYSVVSPEGCASILKRDARKAPDVANHLKLTAYDLYEENLVDEIIEGSGEEEKLITDKTKEILIREIVEYSLKNDNEIIRERYEKFRSIGKIEKIYFNT